MIIPLIFVLRRSLQNRSVFTTQASPTREIFAAIAKTGALLQPERWDDDHHSIYFITVYATYGRTVLNLSAPGTV